mmetsp:Transcript_1433/g.5283  ORF Transcript_1433/g.5283 Transcript_1433/m.5283 type:complete len:397 (+) Transcript_1433:195-1385(+)
METALPLADRWAAAFPLPFAYGRALPLAMPLPLALPFAALSWVPFAKRSLELVRASGGCAGALPPPAGAAAAAAAAAQGEGGDGAGAQGGAAAGQAAGTSRSGSGSAPGSPSGTGAGGGGGSGGDTAAADGGDGATPAADAAAAASASAEEPLGALAKHGTYARGYWPPRKGFRNCNVWDESSNAWRVRGRTYMHDRVKVDAGEPLGKLVAVDWFSSPHRVDDSCGHPRGVTQLHLKGDDRFIFAITLQVPAEKKYTMVFYYALPRALVEDEGSLISRFIHGTDAFRNARFKLIPFLPKAAYLVQRSVGTKPLIVGSKLQVGYHASPDYFEVDIDIGSSAVANSVVRYVLGYAESIVCDMAFLIQGNSETELPEQLLGTVRVSHLSCASAGPPPER